MKVRSLVHRVVLSAGAASTIALLMAPSTASAARVGTDGVIIHDGPATAGVIIDYGWHPRPSVVTFPPGPTAVTSPSGPGGGVWPPGPTAVGPEV